jgi:hypothetical protein
VLLILLVAAPLAGQVRRERIVLPAAMKRYDSPYYLIQTDLGDATAREAQIRLTRMAEEYYERTREFSGRIRGKFPFYLFARQEDYLAAGGVPGSAGVFMGDPQNGYRLMAFASDPLDARTWQVVQHEGFHQFARAVIGGDMPIWVNEGLAEYFGEAIFTGDGFVTGVIPPWRLQRVRQQIREQKFMPIEGMMTLSHDQWNAMLDRANYDQAWAMVHFLAHGEDGRYQRAFAQFMNAINRRADWRQAWMASFGSARGFEEKFAAWWLGQPDQPTEALYVKATVLTLTSFLARAHQQGQAFDSFEPFARAAEAGALKASPADWLPPSLLADALARRAESGQWALEIAAKQPQIVVMLPDQTRVVGTFALRGDRVDAVRAEVDDLPRLIAEARQLIADGRKTEARQVLSSAIRGHPRSPFAAEARKLVQETR